MSNRDFSLTFSVDQAPEQVFAAIADVRGWWSQAVEGSTDQLGAEFTYHYQDVHRCVFRITEFVPGRKVVWHVVDNHFNFVRDKKEWIGTDVVFEITREGGHTSIRFTHVGLVPDYECYAVCSDAWTSYLTGSLRELITTGRGRPNPIEAIVDQARAMSSLDYTTSFLVDQSPEEVFAAVNDVRGWWSDEITGSTEQVGDAFTFQHKDIHRSTQRIVESVPGQRVVWKVLDSRLSFVRAESEWTGTEIVFEMARKNGQTELRFTHRGLAPACECYQDCSDGWGFFINNSLRCLITAGAGQPCGA